jgi:fructose-1,6-bisphosphatase/inositol monophosphatase family enzyme
MLRTDAQLVDLLHDTAGAIGDALRGLDDWGLAGTRAGQYHSDLAADTAALKVLTAAGVGVLSEESGLHEGRGGDGVVVVVDPVDGSTNASRGIPWFATSLCAVDGDGPRAAVVVDVVHRRRFVAVRGGGATVDGEPLRPSGITSLRGALVGLSGFPPRHLGWRQYRALGAAALDLCAVAEGTLDAYIDCTPSAHGSWDYLGGLLVCREAGAVVGEAFDHELVVLDQAARRTPLAAATPSLYAEVREARRAPGWPDTSGPSGPPGTSGPSSERTAPPATPPTPA